MYVLVALAVTVLVITLAWRGFGADGHARPERQEPTAPPATAPADQGRPVRSHRTTTLSS